MSATGSVFMASLRRFHIHPRETNHITRAMLRRLDDGVARCYGIHRPQGRWQLAAAAGVGSPHRGMRRASAVTARRMGDRSNA